MTSSYPLTERTPLLNSISAEFSDSVSEALEDFVPKQSGPLIWRDLSITKTKKGLWNRKKTGEKILDNCSGSVESGTLMGVFGPSGSGKTTLLEALAGYLPDNFQLSGEIIHGPEINFVPQVYPFFAELRLEEHLKFQSLLRLSHVTKKQRNWRYREIMRDFHLVSCRTTRIEHLSEGEKRLLALGSEILDRPGLLICDEPLSGLDSYIAFRIINTLKLMAREESAVLISAHQISSEVYHQFTKILYLSEGKTAFEGTAKDSTLFLETLHFHLPNSYSPCDYFIHLLNSEESTGICVEFSRLQKLPEIPSQSHLFRIETSPKAFSYPILLRRAFALSTRSAYCSNLMYKIAMGVFLALLYLHIPRDQMGVQDINGIFLFTLAQLSFPATLSVLKALHNDLPTLRLELKTGLYTTGEYYWSKCLAVLCPFLLDGIVMVSIFYWAVGLNGSPTRFALFLFTTFLVEQAAVSFGVFLSTVMPVYRLSLSLGGPMLSITSVVAGLMLNIGEMPSFIRWLQYISFWRYGFEALCILHWDGIQEIECNGKDGCLSSGKEVLDNFHFAPRFLERDLLMLPALTAAFYILGYFCLLVRVGHWRIKY